MPVNRWSLASGKCRQTQPSGGQREAAVKEVGAGRTERGVYPTPGAGGWGKLKPQKEWRPDEERRKKAENVPDPGRSACRPRQPGSSGVSTWKGSEEEGLGLGLSGEVRTEASV